MIGALPKTLEVDVKTYEIRTDFRDILLVLTAYNDPDLTDFEKMQVCLEIVYKTIPENVENALKKAMWFIDGGDFSSQQHPVRLYDWEQDESIIFSAINKVAGYETREKEYLHWWTFRGYFGEIGEGAFSSIVSIRNKLAKGKKLEKYEKDYLRENKEIVKLREKKTLQQLCDEENDREILKKILGEN